MKALIAIVIILAAVFIFTQLVGLYQRSSRSDRPDSGFTAPAEDASGGASLPGLPSYLEGSLEEARQRGPEALGQWLRRWRKQVQDPRLASIELDYVVLLNLKDHKAARELFLEVKSRVPPGSPVSSRIRMLEPAYEN
jgi:hypothetical protein